MTMLSPQYRGPVAVGLGVETENQAPEQWHKVEKTFGTCRGCRVHAEEFPTVEVAATSRAAERTAAGEEEEERLAALVSCFSINLHLDVPAGIRNHRPG